MTIYSDSIFYLKLVIFLRVCLVARESTFKVWHYGTKLFVANQSLHSTKLVEFSYVTIIYFKVWEPLFQSGTSIKKILQIGVWFVTK